MRSEKLLSDSKVSKQATRTKMVGFEKGADALFVCFKARTWRACSYTVAGQSSCRHIHERFRSIHSAVIWELLWFHLNFFTLSANRLESFVGEDKSEMSEIFQLILRSMDPMAACEFSARILPASRFCALCIISKRHYTFQQNAIYASPQSDTISHSLESSSIYHNLIRMFCLVSFLWRASRCRHKLMEEMKNFSFQHWSCMEGTWSKMTEDKKEQKLKLFFHSRGNMCISWQKFHNIENSISFAMLVESPSQDFGDPRISAQVASVQTQSGVVKF